MCTIAEHLATQTISQSQNGTNLVAQPDDSMDL
jgi:hypothetical protein